MGGSAVFRSVEEFVLLVRLGNFEEGVVSIALSSEDNSRELGAEASDVPAVEKSGGGASLFVDPADDGVLGAATSVVLTLTISVWKSKLK